MTPAARLFFRSLRLFPFAGIFLEAALSVWAQAVPRPPTLTALMQAALAPGADGAARAAFGAVWQGWVRAMLLEHADDPALIRIED